MKTLQRLFVLAFALSALAGCVTRSVVIEPADQPGVVEEASVDARFEAVDGRGPEMIAALRAAPAPVRAQIIEGGTPLGDRRTQGNAGYAHVGSIRYAAGDRQAEDKALAVAGRIGADRMLVYRDHVPADGAPGEFLAMYYVRFKLLFGATFRNLTGKEREAVENRGGVQIGSVIGSTPASDANLMSGDLVIAFDGRALRDRVEFQSLLQAAAGRPVTLTVRRGTVTMDRVVRLGAMPGETER